MTTTTRQTPSGVALEDGFSTKLAFAADPDIGFWEVSINPPGREGGEPVAQTTMWNEKWETFVAQQLQTLTQCSLEAAYDPELQDSVDALINKNGWITIKYPDGSTYDFVGYLKTVAYAPLVKGTQPRCTLTIQPTNCLAGVETEPLYTAPEDP